MSTSPVSLSGSFTPPSYFERVVHLVKNLPKYADKASMVFSRWYFSCGPRMLFFLPPSHGIYLMSALPCFLVATGYKHQIPMMETIGSIQWAYFHYLLLRDNREKIRLTENNYEKDFLKIFSGLHACAIPAWLSWGYIRSGLGSLPSFLSWCRY